MGQIERMIHRAGDKAKPEPKGKRTPVTTRPEAEPNSSGFAVDAVRKIDPDPVILEQNRILLGFKHAAAVASYKMLRTRILQRMRSNNWKTLAITSPTQENGKSLTSLNLAISMSMEQRQQVVLVDLDLRSPDLYALLGMGESMEFVNYIESDRTIEESLVRVNHSNLFLLPNSQEFEYSSEVLASPKIAKLVNELKSIGDDAIVIFDLPPLTVDDALAFVPNVDAVLMVVAERVTRREDLRDASELLGDQNIIGTVLNMSNESTSSYY